MAVDMGSAQGRLTLNASDFINQIDSAITELQNLRTAQAQTVQSITQLQTGLVGAGSALNNVSSSAATASSSISGSLGGVTSSANTASTSISNVGAATQTTSTQTRTFGNMLQTAFQHIKNAIPDMDTMISSLDAFGKKATTAGKNLSKYITTPLAGLGVYSVKTSMSFEKAMSQVQATMGATKEDMTDLEAAAKNMGETTQFTSIQAAEALNYLALAGYSSEQMIAALPSVLNLAAAGGIDLGYASDMLTDSLSALNLASKDSDELMANMTLMVDQMAKTASSSNTSVSQLGDAILTVGGTATYLSGGIGEINQVLGLLADRGIKASEAGTHLRNIILAMQPATDAAKDAFVKVGLGIEDADGQFQNLAYDAEGNLKPLSEIFAILNEGMKDMSDQEKQSVLADIFHRTDLASAQALIGTTTERWNELADAINSASGSGAQMAQTQLDNLSGKMTLLKSQADGAATTIGEELSPEVANLADKLSELITKFSSLSPEVQASIVKFGAFLALLGPILTGIGKIASGLGVVLKALKGLGNALAAIRASSFFATLASGFSKIGTMASAAVAKIGTAFTSGISALAAPATASLGTVLVALLGFIAGYGIGTLIYNAIGDEIDEVLHPVFDVLVDAWETTVDFFTTAVPETLEGFFDLVVDFVSRIKTGISEFIDTVDETVEGAIDSVVNFVSSSVASVSEFFTGLWESIVETFTGAQDWVDTNVMQPILDVVVPIVSKLAEIVAKIWEIITALFSALSNWIADNVISPIIEKAKKFKEDVEAGVDKIVSFVKSKIESAKNFIESVVSFISSKVNSFVEIVKTKFNQAYEFIVSVFSTLSTWWSKNVVEPISNQVNKIKTFISNAFQTAKDAVTTAFENIKDWFQERWDGIKEVFSGVGDFFSEMFSKAWDNIENAFSKAKSFFSDLWDSITDTFDYAAETIGDIFTDAFKEAFNGLMELIEDMINVLVDGVNSAVDAVNEIPGVDISTIDRLDLPRLAVGLDYVPYDNYQALLHKGERVLTKSENEEYSSGNYRQGGDTFIFNSPEAIDELTAAQEMKRVKQELAEGF